MWTYWQVGSLINTFYLANSCQTCTILKLILMGVFVVLLMATFRYKTLIKTNLAQNQLLEEHIGGGKIATIWERIFTLGENLLNMTEKKILIATEFTWVLYNTSIYIFGMLNNKLIKNEFQWNIWKKESIYIDFRVLIQMENHMRIFTARSQNSGVYFYWEILPVLIFIFRPRFLWQKS